MKPMKPFSKSSKSFVRHQCLSYLISTLSFSSISMLVARELDQCYNKKEANYALGIKHQAFSIYDKEMLVVLLAVKKWHSYLVRRRFHIRADHQSLRFLSNRQAITLYKQK
ncbi:Integrase, catalytic core [Gossypium australe]|uniref:Integrase, catalytic core n=1 Tax=Gossypium australe TaxID=47621 RepID=A0A5B6WVZ6_9ROSI|nr:Integrase, catalytic core [Gossypium australe]